ncbi:O-antigen polymerase [Streptococcus cuniculi]|uniref:Oligosaccharide repeat unit polymerase n=1 Tax=Streptococcus cuniculi TaxID=1432788 RepID=A0A4Y9JER8_9STRE|nr:O-antigen polymerase [Streptococcus cuniculi]MBF0777815.1 oligosaccharide repeat unit polymerase [Streptococcus cuniculi]TFU98449.1 oligosaccharide repeat unit polymerase [Streptococcus cuniculi]
MIYLLLIVSFALLGLDFYRWRSLIRPTILFLLSFVLASSIIMFNQRNWDVVLSDRFMVYTLTAIGSFYLGTLLIDYLPFRKKSPRPLSTHSTEDLSILAEPSKVLFGLAIIAMIAYILLIFRGIELSTDVSFMLRQIYDRNVEHNGSNTFIVNQLVKLLTAIANISFFQFLLDTYVVKTRKHQWTHGVIIMLFLLMAVISTDRNILLRFFIYCAVLWILFFTATSKGKITRAHFKPLLRLALYLLITVGIFYLFGKLKGYKSDFGRAISLYGGSGLYNFNLYIEKFIPNHLHWGATTFKSFLGILGRLGFVQFVHKGASFSEYITYTSSTGAFYHSNIYSAMRPFVDDFAYVGVLIFPFVMGITFETLYGLTQKQKYSFSWIFYSLTVYPLAYFTIAEQFFARMHLGLVYEIGWVLILYWYIRNRRMMKEKLHEWK